MSEVVSHQQPAVPWSQEAEQAVIGSLLIDNTAFDQAANIVTAQSFWHRPHGVVFDAIAGLVLACKPADVMTVFQALKDAGKADECGGMAYLNAMAQSVPSARGAKHYAGIVAKKSAERELITAARQAVDVAIGPGDMADKLDKISVMFGAIQRTQMQQAPRALSTLLIRAVDRYSDLADGKREVAWRTGILPLDRMLNGGLRPGKLYCVAARPSVGKSSAARAIGLSTAIDGHPTLLLSQEMPDDEVTDCVVAQLGRIDGERLQTGQLGDGDWSAMTDAVERGASLPFYVDDQGGLTLAEIKSKARMVPGLRVLMLDYLQLSTSTLRGASTNDQVAEISKGLKQLALQMRVAVVVLSQLNREVEKRQDKEPQLSDLRDSGAIEQDIDVAVMLWTHRELDKEATRRVVGWKVAKHRGGRKGKFAMEFDAPRYLWSETNASLDPPTTTEARAARRGFAE